VIVNRSLYRRISLMLCLLVWVWPLTAHAEKQNWEQLFGTQVQQWIETIVQRDGHFREWRQAKTEVHALGANQHQWLVTVTRSGKQVGYMVVGEVPNQAEKPSFVLLEYGVGEFVLFDDAFAPRELAAEPVYDGFASYWRVAHNGSQQIVDAKTGEHYPEDILPDSPVMNSVQPGDLAGSALTLTTARTFAATQTDPFDQIGWMHDSGTPLRTVTWKRLLEEANQTPVTLTVSLFQNQVLAPFSVISLHLWEDRAAYVGVWNEGLRFVPYSYAQKVGTLHANEKMPDVQSGI
jgi:hypothetical protein